jgi:leucyl/phenylalanyl-tRNA---protein transferase
MVSRTSRHRRVLFPPVSWTSPDGVIAVGGRPDPDTLLEAYRRGIFPWPHAGMPLLWFCPDPRFVLVPGEAHIARSLRKEMRRGGWEIRADTAFAEVMRACATVQRPGQGGTWITAGMLAGYTALHARGVAHSIETWRGGELVGGVYGVSLGRMFFGESMFARVPEASKVAFATLLANLVSWDFQLIDCQNRTDHLTRFGAVDWPRPRFLAVLERAMTAPTRPGPWTLDIGPEAAAEVLAAASSSEDRKAHR